MFCCTENCISIAFWSFLAKSSGSVMHNVWNAVRSCTELSPARAVAQVASRTTAPQSPADKWARGLGATRRSEAGIWGTLLILMVGMIRDDLPRRDPRALRQTVLMLLRGNKGSMVRAILAQ